MIIYTKGLGQVSRQRPFSAFLDFRQGELRMSYHYRQPSP